MVAAHRCSVHDLPVPVKGNLPETVQASALSERESDAKDYLLNTFGLADAYLFTVLKRLPFFNVDIKHWPDLASFIVRIEVSPSVQAAMAAEEAVQPV